MRGPNDRNVEYVAFPPSPVAGYESDTMHTSSSDAHDTTCTDGILFQLHRLLGRSWSSWRM